MVFIWLQLQLRNAAEKPYLWCAQDVLLKKSASAEESGPSSIHSISILIIWVHIHLISIQYSFTTLVFFFVCFDVFGLVRRNGYQKSWHAATGRFAGTSKWRMFGASGGAKRGDDTPLLSWLGKDRREYLRLWGISKIPFRMRRFPVVQTRQTIETQPKWSIILT